MCDSREKNTGLDALNEAFMELDRAYVQLARACGLSEAEFETGRHDETHRPFRAARHL